MEMRRCARADWFCQSSTVCDGASPPRIADQSRTWFAGARALDRVGELWTMERSFLPLQLCTVEALAGGRLASASAEQAERNPGRSVQIAEKVLCRLGEMDGASDSNTDKVISWVRAQKKLGVGVAW